MNTRPIRRSQIINTFGIGSLVNFRNGEVLMTAGLDQWPSAKEIMPENEEWLITEERLQARLGTNHFRFPPEYREHGHGVRHAEKHVPFVRFPRWHYCPRTGEMRKLRLYNDRIKCPCGECEKLPNKSRPYLVQSPYVAVCGKGHIEDFPFARWVHSDGDSEYVHGSCRLRWLSGRSYSGRFVGKVRCSCGQEKSLKDICSFSVSGGGALNWIGHRCSGNMPWLDRKEPCDEPLRVVQRTASNVYFPRTISSIYIPFRGSMSVGKKISDILDTRRYWEALTKNLGEGDKVSLQDCKFLADMHSVDPEKLREAAQQKLDGTARLPDSDDYSEEEFRWQEYEVLRSGEMGGTTELVVKKGDLGGGDFHLHDIFDGIRLVKKLRETQVFVGFSRLEPPEEVSGKLLPISEDYLNWRPATVTYGEGIFLEFNKEKLDNWSKDPRVVERTRNYKQYQITAKYVLLHTFAHALIRQMSYDCGYGSASLRERIYCNAEDSDKSMQGVLIYTASGDSEGSLGGLVRQGEADRLKCTVDRAMEWARWCSSDPVCIESSSHGGLDVNLSACHGCVLLPETSCEKGNRFLDRGLLVGTMKSPQIGFFRDFLKDIG